MAEIRKGLRGRARSEIAVSGPDIPSETESLLTEEEMRAIEQEIIEEIEKEERERLKKKYREEATLRMKRDKGLAEEQVEVLIDVAGHAQDIKLDGRPYYHGHTYVVGKSIADTLFDIMGRTWDHEESVGGANQNEYRKPRKTRMVGLGGALHNAPTRNSSMGVPLSGGEAPSAPRVPVQQQAISPLSQGRMGPKVTTTQSLRGHSD